MSSPRSRWTPNNSMQRAALRTAADAGRQTERDDQLRHDPNSIHTAHGWQGQHARVRRWYARVEGIAAMRPHEGDRIADQDFLHAFFQNCHYLREWLLRFDAVPKADLDALYDTTLELRLCRDICNSTKHVDVSQPSESPFVSIFREYDHFYVPVLGEGPHAMVEMNVRVGETKLDIFELARRCMDRWDEFLRTRGLLDKAPV